MSLGYCGTDSSYVGYWKPATEEEKEAIEREYQESQRKVQAAIQVKVSKELGTGEYPWYHESFEPRLFYRFESSSVEVESWWGSNHCFWLPDSASAQPTETEHEERLMGLQEAFGERK